MAALLLALVPPLAQYEGYSWEGSPPYYYDSSGLPGDPASCCGASILGDKDDADDPYICGCDL